MTIFILTGLLVAAVSGLVGYAMGMFRERDRWEEGWTHDEL